MKAGPVYRAIGLSLFTDVTPGNLAADDDE